MMMMMMNYTCASIGLSVIVVQRLHAVNNDTGHSLMLGAGLHRRRRRVLPA